LQVMNSDKGALLLTEELVRQVHRDVVDAGYDEGTEIFSEDDYETHLEDFLRHRPSGALHVFTYGSLIWKPAFQPQVSRKAFAPGWQRSFCLRIKRFRGTREQPGLMMALDTGECCEGFLQQLHEHTEISDLRKLWRREMTMKPPGNMPRWIDVEGPEGMVPAIAFTANRDRPTYAGLLDTEEIADILSKACGHWGSGAEYLRQTILALEAHGIHDEYLWRLQKLVAEKIKRRSSCL
jgi:glutathione-specific gamma-glutamylcyclotransferase